MKLTEEQATELTDIVISNSKTAGPFKRSREYQCATLGKIGGNVWSIYLQGKIDYNMTESLARQRTIDYLLKMDGIISIRITDDKKTFTTGHHVIRGDDSVILKGTARAELRNTSTATLYNQAQANLRDQSFASLHGQSRANLYDQSMGVLNDQAQADLHGQSQAYLFDDATASLSDQSRTHRDGKIKKA
ncbi:MAG: hypothetical protein U9N86_03300 [Bacteroidota bacterium]|nr:hypothetical protein [Bacteroidota bacterium]